MISIFEISPRIRLCLYKQLAFCQRAVTELSHAATPKHCWACSQRSGTLTRCSADRKLGHFQTEGQILGVGGVEVHMTLEDSVTSAFICDFAVHLSIPLQAVSTVSRSTNCCSLIVNNYPVAIDQAPSKDPAVEKRKCPTPLSSVSAPSNEASVNAAQIVNEGVKSDVLHNAAMAEN